MLSDIPAVLSAFGVPITLLIASGVGWRIGSRLQRFDHILEHYPEVESELLINGMRSLRNNEPREFRDKTMRWIVVGNATGLDALSAKIDKLVEEGPTSCKILNHEIDRLVREQDERGE